MKAAVIVFPGSNCDHDMVYTLGSLAGMDAYTVWHRESDLKNPDAVIIPGGFSFGDYLRTGALASRSAIMQEVKQFAERGGPVLGICNGFQILCESGLLPGALLQNRSRKFLSRFLTIRVENTKTPFTSGYHEGELITCPVAHFEGNYFARPEEIARLEDENRVIFRYVSPEGEVDEESEESNPNGSVNSIAGISNKSKNVVGLMPHPERASEELVGYFGKCSGLKLFNNL